MPTYIKTLEDKQGNSIYPQTKVAAVYDANNVSLQSILDEKLISNSLTVNLTTTGWVNNVQTVAANNVTSSNTVIVSPKSECFDDWMYSGTKCISQGLSSLTFTCIFVPESTITVDVLIIDK